MLEIIRIVNFVLGIVTIIPTALLLIGIYRKTKGNRETHRPTASMVMFLLIAFIVMLSMSSLTFLSVRLGLQDILDPHWLANVRTLVSHVTAFGFSVTSLLIQRGKI